MRDPDGIVKTHEIDVHFQDTSVARRQEKSGEESDESKTGNFYQFEYDSDESNKVLGSESDLHKKLPARSAGHEPPNTDTDGHSLTFPDKADISTEEGIYYISVFGGLQDNSNIRL
jgi:hypothetical protein